MAEENILIQVREGVTVSAVRVLAEDGTAKAVFVYAPGAGSNINDPFGEYLSPRLADTGFSTLRFQFPYMEAGKRRPDQPKLLKETWRQVIASVEAEGIRTFIGGRSMGGRIASQVVAQGCRVDGLALFAYPLSPPGNPSKRRDEHLPRVDVPTLFCSGTRDNFAGPDQLKEAAALVPRSTVHLLDGADHGFAVLKSSGRTREDVWSEAAGHLLDWLATG